MAQYLDWFQACGRSAPGWEKIMRCFNSLERDPMQKPSSVFCRSRGGRGQTPVFTFAAASSRELPNRKHAQIMIRGVCLNLESR
jgi:hypothetical protein